MNETKEKITPLKNSEDYEKLKADYEKEIQVQKEKVEEWKNTAIKSDEHSLAKDKVIERLENERDDWKKDALANRKVYQENKKTIEQTSFVEEFQKLQNQKLNKTNN